MSLADIVKKVSQPFEIKAVGTTLKYCELSPSEEAAALENGRKKAVELLGKDATQEQKDEFAGYYKTLQQLLKGQEKISETEFFTMSAMDLAEINAAIFFSQRENHPQYFERLEILQREQSAKLLEAYGKLGEKKPNA